MDKQALVEELYRLVRATAFYNTGKDLVIIKSASANKTICFLATIDFKFGLGLNVSDMSCELKEYVLANSNLVFEKYDGFRKGSDIIEVTNNLSQSDMIALFKKLVRLLIIDEALLALNHE